MRKTLLFNKDLVISIGDTSLVTLHHIAGELVLKVIAENLELEKQWKVKAGSDYVADGVLFDFIMWMSKTDAGCFGFPSTIEKYTKIEKENERSTAGN